MVIVSNSSDLKTKVQKDEIEEVQKAAILSRAEQVKKIQKMGGEEFSTFMVEYVRSREKQNYIVLWNPKVDSPRPANRIQQFAMRSQTQNGGISKGLRISLSPGRNEVLFPMVERFRKTDSEWQRLESLGAIRVKDPSKEQTLLGNIYEMNITRINARDLIENVIPLVEDQALLKEWYSQEKRKTVKSAIRGQLSHLKNIQDE